MEKRKSLPCDMCPFLHMTARTCSLNRAQGMALSPAYQSKAGLRTSRKARGEIGVSGKKKSRATRHCSSSGERLATIENRCVNNLTEFPSNGYDLHLK